MPRSPTLRAATMSLVFCNVGAARERIVIDACRLIKIPRNLDFDRAASLSVTYGTALYALKDRARVRGGERLAVLGASGGAGIAAVEIGRLLGTQVIGCASSEEKLGFARRHGADHVINYAEEDLKTGLHRLTGGHGVDVVYDTIGGRYSELALRCMNWGGRHFVIGFASGGP